MQKSLAVALLVVGLTALLAGRLGETLWAPATEYSASVTLDEPGPAVVIDPGVLYIGGPEGTVEITAASDVSVITASNDDIPAYLADARHTRITGLPDWESQNLTTEVVNPDGPTELPAPTASDLWRSVNTQTATEADPATIDVAEFRAGETGPRSQPFRAILLVTDGTAPGAGSVTITWPGQTAHAWIPYAYAGGAGAAVIGVICFVVTFGSGRRARPARHPADEAGSHSRQEDPV